MTKPEFFNKEAARHYDERNSKLAKISDGLHFLTGLILKDLPRNSKILSVGAGTGAEILYLASQNPEWNFVAVDPSKEMLDVAKDRMKAAGIVERCELIHGYVQDVPDKPVYDAVLSLLVAHFIERDERQSYYQALTDRLKPNGYLVNAEISYDLESPEFPSMLKAWEAVQAAMGASPESLKTLPNVLKEVLTILPPKEVKAQIERSGIQLPQEFFQAMMIEAWYGQKSGF